MTVSFVSLNSSWFSVTISCVSIIFDLGPKLMLLCCAVLCYKKTTLL